MFHILVSDKPKLKRRRENESKRWTDAETLMILSYLEEHPNFEKPTAQIFYKKLIEKVEIDCTWHTLRCKVRYLKCTWQKANTVLSSTDAGADDDVRPVEEKVRRVCPFYDRLENIFGSSRESKVVVMESLDFKDSMDDDNCIVKNELESPGESSEFDDNNMLETSEFDDNNILEASEFDDKIMESPSFPGRVKRKKSSTAVEKLSKLEAERMEFREKNLNLEHQKFEWLREMEYQKFEWSKELEEKKESNAYEVECRKLALEERKVKLEEQKLRNDFELRKLELKYKYNQK